MYIFCDWSEFSKLNYLVCESNFIITTAGNYFTPVVCGRHCAVWLKNRKRVREEKLLNLRLQNPRQWNKNYERYAHAIYRGVKYVLEWFNRRKIIRRKTAVVVVIHSPSFTPPTWHILYNNNNNNNSVLPSYLYFIRARVEYAKTKNLISLCVKEKNNEIL